VSVCEYECVYVYVCVVECEYECVHVYVRVVECEYECACMGECACLLLFLHVEGDTRL
jgi:hypothetical protein